VNSVYINAIESAAGGRRGRLSAIMFLLAAAFCPALHATGFTVTTPMPAFTTGTTLLAENNPTLGTFDFSGTPYASFASLNTLSITLSLYDLQTMATGTGLQKRDYNNITLTLGGIDTGIKLNGYDYNTGSTVTTTGTPTNGAAILQALTTSGGSLAFGILDATSSPSNGFDYFGGTASLTLDVATVPFTPSSTLGFALVGAIVLLRKLPWLKRRSTNAA
jgi:hypothetical protein